MVEARLGRIHIEEPAEQQVVVELLAEHPFAAHRISAISSEALQQSLGRDRRPPDRAVHLIEQRRKLRSAASASSLTRRSGCSFGTRSPGSIIINIARCRRSSPRISPLPPPVRLLTQTNYIEVKFRRFINGLLVRGGARESGGRELHHHQGWSADAV